MAPLRKAAPGPAPRPERGIPGKMARSYDAAASTRLREPWLTRFASADTEIFGSARTLRDRSRYLVRNNPYAAKAVASLVSNIVGEGIVPRPVTGNKAKDKRIREAFERWSFRCDAAGQLDFYGLQTLLCREMIEGGEVLVRKRLRKKIGTGDVPLELQLLEADFLDPARNGMLTPGTIAIQGVEVDIKTRKRAAYWLYPQHPGNLWINTGEPTVSAPVPADEVLHVYELQRTQTRGVPWGTPAIENLQLLADYELAEITRKRTEACIAGFVVDAEDAEDEAIAPQVLAADGSVYEKFEPGMIARLRGGKDIKFNAPNAVGGYGEYKVSQLQTIAAGYRVPYELVSNDLSKVNFSSMRGGLVEFRRLLRTIQWHILIQLALQPIWEWWCEIAYLAGVIDEPVIPVQWAPPKFEWVDPMADAQAAQLAMRTGIRSYQDVVSETGRNPDDVLDEINDWNTKCDDLGIVLDSDPRVTNVAGLQQPDREISPGDEPELSRPNRAALVRLERRQRGAAAARAPGRQRAPGKLRRQGQHGRDRLEHGGERSPLLVVGR
jgi:lambda family phage portal protein